MFRLVLHTIALVNLIALPAYSQEKLPSRFDPLLKNDRFRLVRVLGTPEMPASLNSNAAYSTDGKLAVFAEDQSSGGDDKPRLRTRLLVWDLETRAWPREIDVDGKSVSAVCLSKDGTKAYLLGQVVTGVKKDAKRKEPVVEFGSYLAEWDLKGAKELRTIAGDNAKPAFCLALSPDGSTLFAGGDYVYRWSLKDGALLDSYREKDDAIVMSIAVLPDGKRFLAGCLVNEAKSSGVVRLWAIGKTKKAVRSYPNKGEVGAVLSLAISGNSAQFVCGDTLPSLTIWDIDTGNEVATLKEKRPDEIVLATAFSDDGTTALGVFTALNAMADGSNASRLVGWDVKAKKVQWSREVPYRGRIPLRLHDGKLLAGGGPNPFDTWGVKDGKLVERWGGHKGTINAVAALSASDFLSTAHDGSVIKWRENRVADYRPAHKGGITVMALTPDKKHRLTGGADHLLKLWKSESDKPVFESKGHGAPVTALAISKDSRWAVSSSGDRSVKTWDLTTGKEIAAFLGHSEGVNGVALSPDERWLASAGDDALIRVWPLKDAKLDPDRETLLLDQHKKPVVCLAFSPDGKALLSGGHDQTIKVWDWAKEKVVRSIPGHKNWVTSLLFIDDATVLSISDDLSLCLWDWNAGKEIGRLDFGLVSDCPTCVTRVGADRVLVGTSNWLIYELQIMPSGKSK